MSGVYNFPLSVLSIHKGLHLLNYQLPTPPPHDSKVITTFHLIRGLALAVSSPPPNFKESSVDSGMETSEV